MVFTLSHISPEQLYETSTKKVVLYADFNVLNYLYKSQIQINNNIILYPDSTLVNFTIRLFKSNNLGKIVSTDFQENLLKNYVKLEKRIYFFGDDENILNSLTQKLLKTYPGIKIVGTHNGYIYNSETIIENINSLNVDVLFVGLGVSRQEKWIIENYEKINCKLIIAVGGWFQYLSDNKKRASLFFREIHLEWLVKLFNEFKTVWQRYLIGAPLFLYRVFRKKIVITINEMK